jgi:hypothetical protein
VGSRGSSPTVGLCLQNVGHHRNKVLHDTQIESSRAIRDEEEINDEITKLYERVDSFAAEDQCIKKIPLAIRLRKPLRTRRRWLALARVLAAKSEDRIFIGQAPLTAFFQTIQDHRRVLNTSLEPVIRPVRKQPVSNYSTSYQPGDWLTDPEESHSP